MRALLTILSRDRDEDDNNVVCKFSVYQKTLLRAIHKREEEEEGFDRSQSVTTASSTNATQKECDRCGVPSKDDPGVASSTLVAKP